MSLIILESDVTQLPAESIGKNKTNLMICMGIDRNKYLVSTLTYKHYCLQLQSFKMFKNAQNLILAKNRMHKIKKFNITCRLDNKMMHALKLLVENQGLHAHFSAWF